MNLAASPSVSKRLLSTVSIGKNQNRITGKSSTSWHPEDDTIEDETSDFEGLTEFIKDANFKTEKRINRSQSASEYSAVTMSKDHRSLLYPVVKILMAQIKVAREIEHMRIKLSHTDDFNLADLYKLFSTNKETTLVKHEFLKGCQTLGIVTKKKDNLLMIFHRYAGEAHKNRLTFHQFSEIFLPYDSHHSAEISERVPRYGKSFPKDKTKVFKQSTNKCLVELIAKMVKAEMTLKQLQKEANTRCDDVQRCFQLLAKQGNLLRLQSQKSILKNR